jgi:hypothetical protein
MRRILREPLLHFLLIGLALFALFNVVSGSRGGSDRRVVVTEAAVAGIAERFAGLWQRPPTPTELQGLIDTYVHDEILYREGLTMGLDRDDPVIRRRVLQKLDVITEERDASAAPTDAELQKYLDAHAARYARPAAIAFDQVMFDTVKHEATLDADLNTARTKLAAGADPASIGDASMLEVHYSATPVDQIARDFGEEFAAALSRVPVGGWQGPIASGFGAHLVRVASHTPGASATLADARAAVTRDWENDRRIAANADYYRDLRKHYDVVVDAKLPAGVKAN